MILQDQRLREQTISIKIDQIILFFQEYIIIQSLTTLHVQVLILTK